MYLRTKIVEKINVSAMSCDSTTKMDREEEMLPEIIEDLSLGF
jgi:hypothetical protein